MKSNTYTKALQTLADRPIVTIAAGATCAYLGDERTLREFLIADETARQLRQAGHTVFSLLIDDSLDPLTLRQLRVAVNKDENLLEKYKDWCGKPIGLLPDPWGCHASYAAHFEEQLLGRLHHLGCHPTLISTAGLYQRGVYAPYIRDILERSDEVFEFLRERFATYQPGKLFWPLCADCGYIDETQIEGVANGAACVYCRRCERSQTVAFDNLQGKFNWKLDCALRWSLFKIDAEPFNDAYLEPKTGSFAVAQALSHRFFDGPTVHPLRYGVVQMEKGLGQTLLPSLPAPALRALMVEHPGTDASLTPNLVRTMASRFEAMPGLSFQNFIRQVLPMWLLTPETLSAPQRELLAQGIAFSQNFLDAPVRLNLPTRADFGDEETCVLHAVCAVIARAVALRDLKTEASALTDGIKEALASLGETRRPALHRLRVLLGQEHGLPATRFLSLLPVPYLQMVYLMLELHLAQEAAPALPTLSLAA